MTDTTELTDRQIERIDSIQAELKEAEPGVPPPSREQIIDSLLDTWEAIGDGLYHGQNTGSDIYDDVEEFDLWLTPHDMDHLQDGGPVFKGVGENIALVLRAGDWETIERVSSKEDLSESP